GEAFRKAWNLVARRHPVLATAFRWQGLTEPHQLVAAEVDVPFSVHGRDAESLRRFLEEDRRRGFGLTAPPPLRLAVFEGQGASEVVWTFHHAILDGGSIAPVLRDVFQIYASLVSGMLPTVAAAPAPFSSFLDWLSEADSASGKAYFRRLLTGKDAATP